MSVPMSYKLLAPQKRPGSRFGLLPFFNRALTESRDVRSPEYPIKMTRHHVIPWNTLRDFWNGLVVNGHLGVLRGNNRLGSRIEEYIDTYQIENWQPEGRSAAKRLLQQLAGLRHDPAAYLVPDGWQDLMEIYAWLPGNLFLGPNGEFRLDEPDEDFERGAWRAVNPRFGRLEVAFAAMKAYLAAPSERLALDASKRLSRVAESRDVSEFRGPAVWDRVKVGAEQVGGEERPVYKYRLKP